LIIPCVLTVREAADYFGRPPQTIYRWIREGVISHRRDDRGIWVDPTEVRDAHLARARRLRKSHSDA
jgi:excisionase family DNA binding protein